MKQVYGKWLHYFALVIFIIWEAGMGMSAAAAEIQQNKDRTYVLRNSQYERVVQVAEGQPCRTLRCTNHLTDETLNFDGEEFALVTGKGEINPT